MTFIDYEAAAKNPNKCPARIWTGYGSHVCGKPIKRAITIWRMQEQIQVEVCGVHAAAEERAQRNHAARQAEWDAMREEKRRDLERDARLQELGVASWDKAAVIKRLEELLS